MARALPQTATAAEYRPSNVQLSLPANLPYDEWLEVGFDLARQSSGLMWLIGDWWAFGQHHYGDRAAIVERSDWEGPAYQTCMDAAWVATRFQTSRRREVLGFSHHKEVASLDPAAADSLLDEAQKGRWSVRRLREEKAKLLTKGPDWRADEIERRKDVESGFAVVASQRNGPDGKRIDDNLLTWAEAKGLVVRIDRATAWGNPFEMPGDGDRPTVIESYSHHYWPRKTSLHEKLFDLKGKVLVCWCHPEACHGDFLCEQANLLEDG